MNTQRILYLLKTNAGFWKVQYVGILMLNIKSERNIWGRNKSYHIGITQGPPLPRAWTLSRAPELACKQQHSLCGLLATKLTEITSYDS